ncbi:general odorant-binding protein 56h-like [Lucilia sericata]|uniref:general odorant-binding protein 56h-like n=1 Tax=Lucilia sericata TaxID=13632 RepID=UPI0018A84645|nr:general odorant-binding protein 56h-like [Lucilia sericata]
MKFYIMLMAAVLAVAQVQADMKEEMRKLDMACREESHVSADALKSFFSNNMKDEPTDAIKCHLKCFMEKQGHWKNGAFDENAVKKFLQGIPSLKDQQDAVNKAIDDCKNQKGSSECDTAYLITKCMTEHKANLM